MQFVKHGSASGSTLRKLTIMAIPLLVGAGLLVSLLPAYGDQQLLQRSISLSNAAPAKTAAYKLSFTLTAPETLGSIRVQFCANDPIIDTSCTVPGGLDVSGAALSNQTGETGFSVSGLSTNNVLVLTRAPAASGSGLSSYELQGVVNPTNAGSYYLRVQTYSSNDTTGAANDYGGLAFSIADTVSVSAEVPPYLLFCTAIQISGLDCANAVGNYINFGNLSTSHSSSGKSQLLLATNAANGLVVNVNGTTLTSGNNIITAMTDLDISRPSTPQFGINLRANSDPSVGSEPSGPGSALPVAPYNVPDKFIFNDGDSIIQSAGTQDYRLFTTSYLINISKDLPQGIYVSTIVYSATANF